MKRVGVFVFALFLGLQAMAQLKPYVYAMESEDDISAVENMVIEKLGENDFEVLGTYVPAADQNRRVIVVTNDLLLDAAVVEGGLTAFLSALRIGITREGDKTIVSYTTPQYWGNAYFRGDYVNVEQLIEQVNEGLEKALVNGESFQYGSESGLDIEKLRKYRYMMGMPQFDDTHVLASFGSFSEAVSTIDANIAKGMSDASLVYKVQVPGKNLKLYGFAINGEEGESSFMPVIDISSPKHTAFLPYELLVVDNEVHMLHGRFRIALSFPDLTMGTFMKIVATPKDIKRILEEACTPEM
jgi:hypothetical protein